jgi:hypothetical protein
MNFAENVFDSAINSHAQNTPKPIPAPFPEPQTEMAFPENRIKLEEEILESKDHQWKPAPVFGKEIHVPHFSENILTTCDRNDRGLNIERNIYTQKQRHIDGRSALLLNKFSCAGDMGQEKEIFERGNKILFIC